ncbi:hypothetical protein AAFN60_01890 [Roseibacillus persicicus]|uniref:hypothetical protein n=1 Tax=Roseibacillus persicicus TaxID=454148 RepID=UPI00398B59EC
MSASQIQEESLPPASLSLPQTPADALAMLPSESADFCRVLYNLNEAGAAMHMLTTCSRFVLGMELSAAKVAFGETRGRGNADKLSGFKNYGEWVAHAVGLSERQGRRFVALVEALREGRGESIGLPAKLFPEVRPSELSAGEREKLFQRIAHAIGERSFFGIASAVATIDTKAGHTLTDEERNTGGAANQGALTEEEKIRDAIVLANKPILLFEKWLTQGNHSLIPATERKTLIARLEEFLGELKGVGA